MTADLGGRRHALVALVAGHIAIHGSMAGTRLATPLAALRAGESALVVGILLGLFALAPIVVSLAAGRYVDRHGYHRAVHIGIACTVAGGLAAALAVAWPRQSIAFFAVAGLLAGGGANTAMIAMQREAGRLADDATGLKQVFSWMGIAPAFANVVGPVLAGALIDSGGFAIAFVVLAALPLAAIASARRLPRERRAAAASPGAASGGNAWSLLRQPGFGRLLFVNWLLSSSWEVHAFLVPVLGHERGFSASAIGLVLGAFATAVTAVRVVIPVLAHRLREDAVLVGSMLACGAIFAIYPFAAVAWQMGVLAVLLGTALGAVQPMVMTTLLQITPRPRHGEALALRTMVVNCSSAAMPFAFGAVGAALGAGAVFWVMGLVVAGGSVVARRIGRAA